MALLHIITWYTYFQINIIVFKHFYFGIIHFCSLVYIDCLINVVPVFFILLVNMFFLYHDIANFYYKIIFLQVVRFVPRDLHFKLPATQQEVATLLGKGIEVFVENLMRNHPRFDSRGPGSRRNSDFLFSSRAATHDVIVTINVTEQRPTYLTLNTSVEAYKLQVNSPAPHNSILVNIEAESYFGIRNGLETLSQLIAYDDAENNLMIVNHASITDEPAYAYRGLLLDTSRNYISIKEIKHQIDAMAASKLNTFHWHITDSHSFPMQLQSLPEMSAYGAYEPHKIYTAADIKDVSAMMFYG